MAIKRSSDKINKYDAAIEELNKQESIAKQQTDKVIKKLVNNSVKTRTIDVKKQDGTIIKREIKITEKRKTLPVYIPETMYEQFDAINTAYGKSNNSAIVELIRDYVIAKKSVLDEM